MVKEDESYPVYHLKKKIKKKAKKTKKLEVAAEEHRYLRG